MVIIFMISNRSFFDTKFFHHMEKKGSIDSSDEQCCKLLKSKLFQLKKYPRNQTWYIVKNQTLRILDIIGNYCLKSDITVLFFLCQSFFFIFDSQMATIKLKFKRSLQALQTIRQLKELFYIEKKLIKPTLLEVILLLFFV